MINNTHKTLCVFLISTLLISAIAVPAHSYGSKKGLKQAEDMHKRKMLMSAMVEAQVDSCSPPSCGCGCTKKYTTH